MHRGFAFFVPRGATPLATILIIIGALVLAFGLWLVKISMDPLGYSPPATYNIVGVGSLLLMAGIVWKVLGG